MIVIELLKCDVVVDSTAEKVKKFSLSQDVKERHSQIKADSKNHYSSSLNLMHFKFSNVLHNFTFFSITFCITCDLIDIKWHYHEDSVDWTHIKHHD